MTESSRHAQANGPSHRGVEVGVALFTAALGGIVIIGSLQVGIGWGAEGPKSGFFPFYLGVLIVASSGVNLVRAMTEGNPDALFADWGQLAQVLKVVIPTTVYVAAVPWIGIYVASVLLIAAFMKWLGGYGWGRTLAVSFAVMIAAYLMFEKWFLIPLPKGPIEDLLGL